MQREGSPWHGLGVVILKELADHLTSVRMRVFELLVVLIALAALYGAIQQIRDVTAEDPFLFLKVFTTAREPLPFAFVSFRAPGAADRHRAGLRSREWRAQSAHAVAHPVAADLSRRAAVRKIPCRAVHARDQPDRDVAAGDRTWGSSSWACRRMARSWRAPSSSCW